MFRIRKTQGYYTILSVFLYFTCLIFLRLFEGRFFRNVILTISIAQIVIKALIQKKIGLISIFLFFPHCKFNGSREMADRTLVHFFGATLHTIFRRNMSRYFYQAADRSSNQQQPKFRYNVREHT